MSPAPDFDTLYDLQSLGCQHGPMLAIGVLVLAVGLILQVVAGLARWETELLVSELRGGQAQVVQGPVPSHEIQQRASWNSSTQRYDRSTSEVFLVGETAFGFTRGGTAVGFTNGARVPLVLAHGDVLRVHFVEQTPGDFTSRRILKLERLRNGR